MDKLLHDHSFWIWVAPFYLYLFIGGRLAHRDIKSPARLHNDNFQALIAPFLGVFAAVYILQSDVLDATARIPVVIIICLLSIEGLWESYWEDVLRQTGKLVKAESIRISKTYWFVASRYDALPERLTIIDYTYVVGGVTYSGRAYASYAVDAGRPYEVLYLPGRPRTHVLFLR